MNAGDIIIMWLSDNGYDGLCNPDLECGCGIDDFIPCGGEGVIECEAAYWYKDEFHVNPPTEEGRGGQNNEDKSDRPSAESQEAD